MNTNPFRFGISDLLLTTCFAAVVIAITVRTEFYVTLWTLVSLAMVAFYAWRYSHVQGGIVRVGLWAIASIFFCESHSNSQGKRPERLFLRNSPVSKRPGLRPLRTTAPNSQPVGLGYANYWTFGPQT